ncbi:MAG: SH3 domain-containing protein [Spirochaetes bacterium]|nr:SH3 domain-containing protein [Spirochaetota bacterium]
MKKIIIIASIVILQAAVIAGFLLFRDNDVEDAIEEYEDGDYVDAITEFNRLIPLSGYEDAEKLHYYRCRAINRLAERIEHDYDDELGTLTSDRKGSPEFDRARREVTEELDRLNKRIHGDLALVIQKKRSSIVSRGLFYNEFLARYRGSALVEDLDFEAIQQLAKTDPESHIRALINFYDKYPGTGYISQIVNSILEGMQQNRVSFTPERKDVLWGIIAAYVRRYPTSPVTTKLFVSNADSVNLRNSPGLQGDRIGKLVKGEIVLQLEKSMDSSQVGDKRDYWYRITSLTGTRGWIFGKFLEPLDISSLKGGEEPETQRWALEEHFAEWSDSHTPKNWMQMAGADPSSIGFKEIAGRKTVVLDVPKGKRSGLYTRYGSSRAFTVLVKARYVAGRGVTILNYSLGGDASFYVRLMDESVDVTGRTIPLHTSDWHEYSLQSDDGKYASLSIDDEVVSGRIRPVRVPGYEARGVYTMACLENDAAKAELEYIKIR